MGAKLRGGGAAQHRRISASKIGTSTDTAAVMTARSAMQGIPSGRFLPPVFGIRTISANGRAVAVYSRKSNGTNTFSYVLSDHENSVASITNSSGASVVNESFTPFGSRRNPTSWSGAPSTGDLTTAAGITREGYTFQTQLGLWMGLNHMNGRVQDSLTGRFLSADPIVQDAANPQAYNRYTYVYNNPFTNTDPTGFDSCNDPMSPCDTSITGSPDLVDTPAGDGSCQASGCTCDARGFCTVTGCGNCDPQVGIQPYSYVPQGIQGQNQGGRARKPQGDQPTSEVTVTATRCPGVGGNTLDFRQSAPNDPSKGYTPTHDLPDGSFIVTAPNGRQFYAPPNADFVSVYQYGSSLASNGTGIDFGLAWAHTFGGPFDFQRGNNQFNGNFSYAANYAIGIDFAAARQPLTYAQSLANGVKNTVSGGRGSQYASEAIQQGYTAAQSGACGP